jgi:hypothetical protein
MRATSARVLLFLALGLCVGGCLHTRVSPHDLPDFSKLQEGDVVTMFTPTPAAWVFARLGTDTATDRGLPLSHCEFLVEGQGGEWLLTGVSGSSLKSRPLRDVLVGVAHISVFRANRPEAERRDIARFAYEWTRRPDARDVAFDYAMEDIPGRHDAFYCVGFVNEVCRLRGGAVPFFPQERPQRAIGRYLERVCGGSAHRATAVPSILSNPDYRHVLTWRHPRLGTAEALMVAGQITDAIVTFCEEGWVPKGVDLPVDGEDLGPRQKLRRLARAKSRLNAFNADVTRVWRRLERRGRLDGLMQEEKAELILRICREYRETHFVHLEPRPGRERSVAREQLPQSMAAASD